MARTARTESVLGSLIAHFAFAPLAEAQKSLEIATEVLRQRAGGAGVTGKRGPGRPAGSVAGAGTAGAVAVAAGGPVPVGTVKPKRVRVRNRRKNKVADAAAPAAGTGAETVTPAAGEANIPLVADAAPLPDQAAGDQ